MAITCFRTTKYCYTLIYCDSAISWNSIPDQWLGLLILQYDVVQYNSIHLTAIYSYVQYAVCQFAVLCM